MLARSMNCGALFLPTVLVAAAVAVASAGCADMAVPDRVYFTESGAGQYREIGPVVGHATGYCFSAEGVLGAALHNAMQRALDMGGNALLLPDSLNASGVRTPTRCQWGWTLLLIPGAINERVQALAIRVQRGALLDPPRFVTSFRRGGSS
jgi:hypothetical protein